MFRWLLLLALTDSALMATTPVHRPVPTEMWTAKAPLPVAMAEVGVAALDGKIYVIGGTEQHGNLPTIWNSRLTMVYDPGRDAWQSRAALPHGLTHAGVAVLDGKLYVVGGFTEPVHMGPLNLAFVYDPQTDRWSALPPLSSPRGSVAAIAAGGKLHVFGGRVSTKVVDIPTPVGLPPLRAGFGTVNTHEIYDPSSGRWSAGPPMPGPGRDHLGIALLNGKIHLFGGRTADVQNNLERHDVYNPATGHWTRAAPLPRARSAGAYTVLDGRILYAGGECKPGGQPYSPNAYDDVTAYNPKSDSWTTLQRLPRARHAFGAATVGHVAYFVAGAPVCGGGAMTDVTALTLPKRERSANSRNHHRGR